MIDDGTPITSMAIWAGVWQEFPDDPHCLWVYDSDDKNRLWWTCSIFYEDYVAGCSTFNAPDDWAAGKKEMIYAKV
jgi:hypothetical protein